MATARARMGKQWRKGLGLLRHNLLRASDWQLPGSQRQAVARQLLGPRAEVAVVGRIEGGADNLHILRCRAEDPQTGRTIDFVEKSTRNLPEFRVATALACERITPPVVEIYGATLMFDRYAICMEYIEDARPFEIKPENAPALARALHQLSERGAGMATRTGLRRKVPWFGVLRRAFFDHVGRESEVAWARGVVDALPRVLSHNDLVPSNLVARGAAPADPVFVDIGSMGRNRAGADLHTFAGRDLEGERPGNGGGFFARVSDEYAELMGLNPGAVRVSAHLYAASRALNRAVNRGSQAPFAQAEAHVKAALCYL